MAPERTATSVLAVDAPSAQDLSRLFHRLNNQLGVVLANAELLEAKIVDEKQRARAAQVVAGALDAITSVQELRRLLNVGPSSQ